MASFLKYFVFCTILILTQVFSCGELHAAKGATIFVGSGGGITGVVNGYEMQPDGKVFQIKGNERKELKKLTKKQVKEVYKKIKDSKVKTLQYNKPDNMYKVLEIKEGSSTFKYVWGQNDGEAPAALTKLFEELLNRLK